MFFSCEPQERECKQVECSEVPDEDQHYCRRHLKITKCKRCSELAVLGSFNCRAHGGAERCDRSG